MRKVSVIIILLFAVMILSNSAIAQDKAYRAFGIGVNVLDIEGIISGAGSTVYLPINLGPGFRLEPLLGFNINSEKYDNDSESSSNDVKLGLGIFPTMRKGNAVIYIGGRLGIAFGSSEYKNPNGDVTSDQSEFSFGLSPVIGGEYYFNPHLSLGGEMGIMFRSTTMTDKAISDFDEDEEDTEINIGTQGMVLIRFYF